MCTEWYDSGSFYISELEKNTHCNDLDWPLGADTAHEMATSCFNCDFTTFQPVNRKLWFESTHLRALGATNLMTLDFVGMILLNWLDEFKFFLPKCCFDLEFQMSQITILFFI